MNALDIDIAPLRPSNCGFDIDWSERLTLPLLGRPYAEALEGGDLRLAFDRDRGWIGLALLTGFTFVGYFHSIRELAPALTDLRPGAAT